MKLPQICLNEAATVSISLSKDMIEAISTKFPHFALHFTYLGPQEPKLVPQFGEVVIVIVIVIVTG